MATVLVCMLQEHGHLNPSFKISRTLRARGHDVRYFAIPDLAAHIEAQGFDCVPFLPELYPRGTLEADDRLGLLERRRGVTRRFRVACERLLPGGSLRAAIERLAPRAMIVDVNRSEERRV